jgi:hypothetical protein
MAEYCGGLYQRGDRFDRNGEAARRRGSSKQADAARDRKRWQRLADTLGPCFDDKLRTYTRRVA